MSIDSLSGLGKAQRLASMRPTIAGTSHVVYAGHYLAAQSALKILESDGNAIDPGVAAGLVLEVVQSELVTSRGSRRSFSTSPNATR